jgi:CRP-like cAMP-binding protein
MSSQHLDLQSTVSDSASNLLQVSELELQNIRRIFTQFDRDKSNSIDVEELKDVMASLGVLMDDAHLMELVDQVTVDSDKTELSFDEFLSLITLWKEASQFKLFEGKGFKSLAQQHVESALQTRCFLSDHPARSLWDLLICLFSTAYFVFVLLDDVYTLEKFSLIGLIVADVIGTVVLVVDVLLCSRTCFMEEVRLEDDPRTVFLHYARTWMVVDCLAAFPFALILYASGANTAALALNHMRLLKLFKIPYLWQRSGNVPITSRYVLFHFHFLPLFNLLLMFVLMVHGYTVGWILVKQHSCKDLLIPKGTCEYPFTPALYFVLYTLSTVGLGDIAVTGDGEQFYASFVMCGAMVTNGIVIGKLVAILQRADIKKERRSKLRETLAVLEHFRIPRQLQEEILQFQAHVFEHNLGTAYESIVSGLPAEMRSNISLFVKVKLLSHVPMFESAHHLLRVSVAQRLENAVARPEQFIIVCGHEGDGMYFLSYGFADTFRKDGVYDGTLRSGDYFGEGCLLGNKKHQTSVKAITYCDLWVLTQQMFAALIRRFPKFERHYMDALPAEVLSNSMEGLPSVASNRLAAATGVAVGACEAIASPPISSFRGTRSGEDHAHLLAQIKLGSGSDHVSGSSSRQAKTALKLRSLLASVNSNKVKLQKALVDMSQMRHRLSSVYTDTAIPGDLHSVFSSDNLSATRNPSGVRLGVESLQSVS